MRGGPAPPPSASAAAASGRGRSWRRRAWFPAASRLEALSSGRHGETLRGLVSRTRDWSPCVTPRCHLSAYFCKPRRLPRFRCLNTPQHPSQRRNPSRRSPPSPTPLPTMPRVSLASRHQFFTGAHKRPTRPFDCDACTYMLGALSRAVPERVVRRITLAAMMYKMSAGQFDLVYNSLSFTLASMMAP